jgi:hypothetical protein
MKNHTKQIVKVQTSLFTSDGIPSVMIYTEDHKHSYEGPAEAFLLDMMDDEPKKFFFAWVPEKPGIIQLIEEAPWQSW